MQNDEKRSQNISVIKTNRFKSGRRLVARHPIQMQVLMVLEANSYSHTKQTLTRHTLKIYGKEIRKKV